MHKDRLDIGSPVTGSNVHGGNPPRDLPVRQVHGSNPADAFKRLLGYSDMQTRYGPGLLPIGGSRPSLIFASPTTDVKKGLRRECRTH